MGITINSSVLFVQFLKDVKGGRVAEGKEFYTRQKLKVIPLPPKNTFICLSIIFYQGARLPPYFLKFYLTFYDKKFWLGNVES